MTRKFFLITWPNRWCGDITYPWAILEHIFVFLINRYCGGYFGRQALRTKKTSRKSNFLPGGMAHDPEIFRVDAAFVAAHFTPRVVWGPNPKNGVISQKRPKSRPLFEKKCMNVLALAHIIIWLCVVFQFDLHLHLFDLHLICVWLVKLLCN